MSSDRRDFLKKIGLAGAASLAPFSSKGAPADEPTPAPAGNPKPVTVPRRKFGKHDLTVSCLCLGGHTLRTASDEEAAKIVDAALECGIDFFDNAWDYHGGGAEELMGQLLRGRRDKVFLMTKVCSNHKGGGKKAAMAMLEDSLRRLRTDHLDLWQLHELVSLAQVETAYQVDETLEALTEAKKQGKVRFIGFTGHANAAAHLAMLERQFPFDACLMPVSAVNFQKGPNFNLQGKDYSEQVLPVLVKQQIAALAMKTMGGDGAPIRSGMMTAEEALRYALSQPVASVLTGVNQVGHLLANARIAASFVPMTTAEMRALEDRFARHTGNELYAYYLGGHHRDGSRV
ncbi:MAG: aldo/keto reductase [Candidatus Methylacidiphilales bacterium]|nr:aldo/keto reductase [Candidatus Methylacidiphilales bacterium]